MLSKKAVSPLIATVLLVGIAVASAGIIYGWSKSLIAENLEKFGESISVVCERVQFDAMLTKKDLGYYELLISNQGNDNIKEVSVKAYKGGNSVIKSLSPPTSSGTIRKGDTTTINFESMPTFGIESFDKIEVTPLLMGTGTSSGKKKLSACTDKTMTLTAEGQ